MNHSIAENQLLKKYDNLLEPILLFAEKCGISPEEVLRLMMESYLSKQEKQTDRNQGLMDLSHRQKMVLSLLRLGMSVKEVASEMNITEATVRTHIQRIRERLGCSDLLTLRMKEP